VLYPFAQMANGQQDSLRLAAARIALLPASGKGLFLLSNLKFGQQKSMAQADFVFGECFDRCGRKLGQAKARSNIPGALAAFGRDEFDGILRLLKAQERGEALRLVKRMHVLTLEVFDKLRLQYLSVGHFADVHRHSLFLGHCRATIPAFSKNDLKAPLRAGPNEQGLQHAVFADAGGVLFRRPFCGRASRMALGSERSAFRATHNGSAERKRNRGIRVSESEESCHGQVERLSSIIHAEGVREYCSTDN